MEPVWLEFRFQGSSSCPWLERNALDAWGCKLHAAVIGACIRGSQYSCRRLGVSGVCEFMGGHAYPESFGIVAGFGNAVPKAQALNSKSSQNMKPQTRNVTA